MKKSTRPAPASSSEEKNLTLLGQQVAFPIRATRATLETFPNRTSGRNYTVTFSCEDFTSLCPVTGQPDFAHLEIEYVPDARCVETKSLKFYLAAFRDERSFNEDIVNRILDDLVAVTSPRTMVVRGKFAARGGISLSVEARHPDLILAQAKTGSHPTRAGGKRA